VFKTLILGLLALFIGVASAMPILSASNERDYILLLDEPCKLLVPGKIDEAKQKYFLSANVVFNGQNFQACFALTNGEDGKQVYLVYEDGDEGLVPLKDFSNKNLT
jgi:hypothetical protein